MPTGTCLCHNRQESAFPVGVLLSMLRAAISSNATNYIRGIYKALQRRKKVECLPSAKNSFQPKIYEAITQQKIQVSYL